MKECVYRPLGWTGIPSKVYSNLTPSVPRIVSVSTAALTRIKMNEFLQFSFTEINVLDMIYKTTQRGILGCQCASNLRWNEVSKETFHLFWFSCTRLVGCVWPEILRVYFKIVVKDCFKNYMEDFKYIILSWVTVPSYLTSITVWISTLFVLSLKCFMLSWSFWVMSVERLYVRKTALSHFGPSNDIFQTSPWALRLVIVLAFPSPLRCIRFIIFNASYLAYFCVFI